MWDLVGIAVLLLVAVGLSRLAMDNETDDVDLTGDAVLPLIYGRIPHNSKLTHSNATAPPFFGPDEYSGSFSNVGHRAEVPSKNASSRYRP